MQIKTLTITLSILIILAVGFEIKIYVEDPFEKNYSAATKLYQKMSLDEKIGQLLQPSYALLTNTHGANEGICSTAVNTPGTPTSQIIKSCGLDQIRQYHIGAVLTGGGPYFNAPTLANWAALNALATAQHRLGNPLDPILLIGNDAIHGNMHVQGAVIFPHNIGLGVTHNPQLIEQIGRAVGQDSLASGFNWVYMPTVAVAQDLRWGRTYESFGQQPLLVKTLAQAYVNGFQAMQDKTIRGPIACAKHFIGDGATKYGFDEGDDAYQGTQADFWAKNGQGYEGALQANVATIMTSYSAIDDAHTNHDSQMHFGGKWDILNQFKNIGIKGTDGQNYRFTGFVISDWDGPTRAAYFYSLGHKPLTLAETMAKTINGGVDMIMLGLVDHQNPLDGNSPLNFKDVGEVVSAIKSAYQRGLISEARLKDAVTRILAVKLTMRPQAPANYAALQAQERQLALAAAEQSLVLLKNNHATLPLKRSALQHIIFIGDTNDIGVQNGGWTIHWQGQKTNRYFTGVDQQSSGALSVESGVKAAAAPHTQFYHTLDPLPNTLSATNSVAICVVAEVPYAEYMGDIGNPHQTDFWYALASNTTNAYLSQPQSQFLGLMFTTSDAAAIQALRKQGIPIITVVYSGRPLILSTGGVLAPLPHSDALIAAFLPGTLGGKALSNALFGDYRFRSEANGTSNTLTFPWPANMDQVANHFTHGALFSIHYGLAT